MAGASQASLLSPGLAERLFWPVLAATALLVVWGVWSPYSFWVDEIFSVVAAGEPVGRMFSHWILFDVHPPVYQLLLNGWVHVFGQSELAVRSLSVLAALAVMALTVWLRTARRELTGFCLLLLAMPWFIYNAQEARSYIDLYLLALLALAGLLTGHRLLFLASLVLMSWTHYFGLFMAMSLLFVQVIMVWRIDWRDVITALCMLAWMPFHLAFGNLFDNASGGFWIQVGGPGETLANFFSALSPAFQQAWRVSHQVAWGYALILLAWLGYFPWRQWRGQIVARLDLQLSWTLLLFVTGIVVVDLVVPMSTQRNFLIAMPFMVFLLYRIVCDALPARLWPLFLGFWLMAQLGSAWVLMQHKQSSVENYRKTTQAVMALMDQGYQGRYLDSCEFDRRYNSDAINNFYLKRMDASGRELQRLCVGELGALQGRVAVLACHQMPLADLAARLPASFQAEAMDAKGLCTLIAPR